MYVDSREHRTLRAAGVDEGAIEAASEQGAARTRTAADGLDTFVEDLSVVHSEVGLADSDGGNRRRWTGHIDLLTHAQDSRGYRRFTESGVQVEGERALWDEVLEVTRGPTVDDGGRFAAHPTAR